MTKSPQAPRGPAISIPAVQTIDTYPVAGTELQRRLATRFGAVEFFVVRIRDRETLFQTENEEQAREFAWYYREMAPRAVVVRK